MEGELEMTSRWSHRYHIAVKALKHCGLRDFQVTLSGQASVISWMLPFLISICSKQRYYLHLQQSKCPAKPQDAVEDIENPEFQCG